MSTHRSCWSALNLALVTTSWSKTSPLVNHSSKQSRGVTNPALESSRMTKDTLLLTTAISRQRYRLMILDIPVQDCHRCRINTFKASLFQRLLWRAIRRLIQWEMLAAMSSRSRSTQTLTEALASQSFMALNVSLIWILRSSDIPTIKFLSRTTRDIMI